MGLGEGWKMLTLCGFNKNPVYRGRGEVTKNKYIGGNWIKEGLGQFADLRGVGIKWGVFEGGRELGRYTNAHYDLGNNFNCDFNLLIPMSSLLISNKKSTILQLIGY